MPERTILIQLCDIPRYIELRRLMLRTDPHAFGAHPGSDGALDPLVMQERLGSETNTIAAAEAGDRLIATAGVYRDVTPKVHHRAIVWGVYVHPDHRGRGLGRAVVERAIAEASAWDGVDRVCLSVSAGASGAQRLYESLGFAVWGREPECLDIDGTRYDEIHMQLALR